MTLATRFADLRAADFPAEVEVFDRIVGQDACVWCGATLEPNPAPRDPVVLRFGRLCAMCARVQDLVRDYLDG